MQTLIEQYNNVYNKVSKLNGLIADYSQQIQDITLKRDEEIPERIANLKTQLEKIDEYQLKIDGFIQLAEKHMISKNLATIEAPEGYRVNLNRLRAWSMLIDPMAEDDVYAQKVHLVANCDKKFLEQKKDEFNNRIEELEEDYNIGAPEQLKDLINKIESIRLSIKEYLDSSEVSSFAESVCKYNNDRIYSSAPSEYGNQKEEPKWLIPGAYGTAIDIIDEHRDHFKAMLGRYYDERNSKVYLPIERITAGEEFAITISCVPARKKMNEMDAGIRNLLFQIIDKSPSGSRRIYIIDAIRENSALVGGLKGLEGTVVLENVPRNDEQIQEVLERIVSTFSDIDETLENHDTVLEYNGVVDEDKRIQRSVVVLVGWPNEFKNENEDYVKKIISNYERYGISFIAVKVSSGKDKDGFGFSDYVGENIINISMTMKETLIRFGAEEPHSFAWYPFKHQLSSDYCNGVKSISRGKGKKTTDYADRGLLDGNIEYIRGKKLLELPYGVDGKDILHTIVFENENFASFLMGASGSGKSTFLHSLITGIIKNYHPDDVELWLADFKMSEFAQYIDPMPPHVKYILLDESQELIFDLIDQLTEKMMYRQRFFMRNRGLKKVEKVSPDIYMPVIFVILDEFSIMSQAVNDSQEYRLKLQNLLAKGRALGIKFLFSSQTFTTGITGLTPTAKAQIQMRIAMKAAKPEIVETLELSPSQRTDQVQNWIDALPVYHALIKYRDKSDNEDKVLVRRTTVLYFDDKESPGDPYKKQRELISKVNEKMHREKEYLPGNIDSYVDKNPVIVDGNSYDVYNESFLLERYEKYKLATDVEPDEILLSFGRPRLMTDIKLVSLTQEARENILLMGAINEQMCAASIIASVAKQFILQGNRVQIWTYSRARIFKTYETVLAELGVVVRDMSEICSAIRSIRSKVESKEIGNDLIILLGMERICGDFQFADSNSSLDQYSVNPLHVEEAPRVEFTPEEKEDRERAMQWISVMLRIEEENQDKSAEELQSIIAEAEKEFFSQFERAEEDHADSDVSDIRSNADDQSVDNIDVDTTENVLTEQPLNQDISENKSEYNALADLHYILMHGSRHGYHFMTYISSWADFRMTQFKLEWFRHRLSFQLSADDSREVFGSKIGSLLPEHVCQYYDLLEGHSFRSYLNKGIDWDGWGVGENNELISPYM